MFELIVGILLAAGATYFVLLPILRPPLEPETNAAADEGDDPAARSRRSSSIARRESYPIRITSN